MESDCPLSVGQKAKEEKPKSLEWQGTNRNRLKNWCARLCLMQVASRDLLAWDETPFFKKALDTIQDFLFGLRVKPDGCYLFFIILCHEQQKSSREPTKIGQIFSKINHVQSDFEEKKYNSFCWMTLKIRVFLIFEEVEVVTNFGTSNDDMK